jgi:hypothetical protein
MKYLFLLTLLIGCPKQQGPDTVERERKEALEEIMNQDDEFYDDLPDEETKQSEEDIDE